MNSTWSYCTWGDIATLEYGKSLRDYHKTSGNIPVYGTNGQIGWTDKALCNYPSVIVGRKGAYRGVHFAPTPFFVIDTAFYLKPSQNINTKWAYYYLLTQDINSMDSGSAIPSTSREDFYSLEVIVPPLELQERIAEVLGSLDDKIELNRRMNATLEATTRTLFKSWFVDFDPVHYKARGEQPPGMDAETAALFPHSFEDSELGMIPAGWRVGTIGDVAHIKHGYAFEGEYFSLEPSDNVLLTPGNFAIGGGFKGEKFKYYSGPIPEEYVLEEDDLLVTMTDLSKAGDTLGYPALIPKPEKYRFLHNQRLGKVIIKPTSWISKLFLYCLMRTDNYRQEILGSATGSTVKHTSPNRIQAFAFPLPSPQAMRHFDDLAVSLYSGIKVNEQLTITLAETRDALLPKLVSGELRVGEV